MDSRRSQTEHSRAMPPDWGFALGVLLRAGAGDRRESRVDATARRAVDTFGSTITRFRISRWETDAGVGLLRREEGRLRRRRFSQRKKKDQKERKQRPVKTAAAAEIEKGCLRRFSLEDFHCCLKKASQKPLRLFHSYHRPAGGNYDNNGNFQRLRSTLKSPVVGPKNGEPLNAKVQTRQ
jgi:hypothetical protein